MDKENDNRISTDGKHQLLKTKSSLVGLIKQYVKTIPAARRATIIVSDTILWKL